MTRRQWPQWSELQPLLLPRAIQVDATARRLAHVASIRDLRLLARRRAPRAVFDYADGGAGDEISLRRSRAVYRRVEFQPRVLRDVSSLDLTTTILGAPAALPLVFAPTGFTRMMHTEGEPAVAKDSRADRHPLRAVDDGDDVDRAAGGGGTRVTFVVPALPLA